MNMTENNTDEMKNHKHHKEQHEAHSMEEGHGVVSSNLSCFYAFSYDSLLSVFQLFLTVKQTVLNPVTLIISVGFSIWFCCYLMP